MKPAAMHIIGFFYNLYFNSGLNRCFRCHTCQARLATAQRENDAHAARILHQGVLQMRSRLQAL